ncbi:MAG: hypothetical protein NVSMB24_17900 [Mucilaginibacter sp.]
MKHFYVLLLGIILSPSFLLAQSNYKPGYVVTLKGDTVRGFIDYRNWDSNPSAISFRSTPDDRGKQKFTVSNIRLFSISGFVTYKRFVCSVSLDETNTAHLNTARDSSYKIDTVFLKVLQQGKYLALYAYADQIKMRFYVGEYPDYIPTELVYRLYYDSGAVTDNRGRTVNENTYLKQLFALATKYNALDDDLNRDFQGANYLSTDILDIVSKINGITKKELKKNSEQSKFNFFINAAVNISNTTSGAGSSYTLGGGIPYTSYKPAASLGINFVPNSYLGKVEFRFGISVAQTEFNPMYQLKVSPYVPVRATFDQVGFSAIPEIICNFYNAENFKFYGGVGFLITHFSYSNAHFGSQNPAVSDGNIGSTEPYLFNTMDDSFKFQAGIQFRKKFEIFANYATSTATTKGGYWQLNTSNSQIGILYLIGK